MLKRKPRPDGQEERDIFGMHPGDLGVIAIAAMCTIALILMLIMPSPFGKYEEMQVQAAKAERQKKIDDAVATGVISVGIPAPSKKP